TSRSSSGTLFWGANATTAPTLQGIYQSNGTTLTRIADTTQNAPGPNTPFTGFSSGQLPATTGTIATFRGTFSGGSGLYANNAGTLERIVDTTVAIPGGVGNFQPTSNFAGNTTISGTTAVFRASGSSSQQGIYLRDIAQPTNPVVRITDKTQLLPGTTNLITTIFEPTISGTKIRAIASAGTGTQRIVQYEWNGSSSAPSFAPTVLVKFGDAVPEQPGQTFVNFTAFVPGEGEHVFFNGAFNDGLARTGIYWFDGTTTRRIIDTTQQLDGKSITSLLMGQDGASGNFVTFQALFSNGTQGIYRVNYTPIPEPGLVFGTVLGGIAFSRWRCSRHRRAPIE
ncbi:MAG: DUF7453 family protein, partial [Gemmataceae bacterium]